MEFVRCVRMGIVGKCVVRSVIMNIVVCVNLMLVYVLIVIMVGGGIIVIRGVWIIVVNCIVFNIWGSVVNVMLGIMVCIVMEFVNLFVECVWIIVFVIYVKWSFMVLIVYKNVLVIVRYVCVMENV